MKWLTTWQTPQPYPGTLDQSNGSPPGFSRLCPELYAEPGETRYKAHGRMTSPIRIKDYRGLTALSQEQEQQLQAATAANEQALRKLHAAGSYTFVNDMPTARLNSGYDIPLVGLGTW